MCPAFGSGDLAASILQKHALIGDNEDDYEILNYWTKRGWRTREAAMAAFAESWRGS
jgi:hypothetical protein